MLAFGLSSKIRIVDPSCLHALAAIKGSRSLDQCRSLEGKSLMNSVESGDSTAVSAPAVPSLEIDSVALQRLIDEVRTSEPVVTSNYNRTYNRHNR